MGATKIDGKAIAQKIRERLSDEVKERQRVNPRYKPCLKIIQVGDRPDSTTYVRMKLKAAEEAGIACALVHLPSTISEPELLQQIEEFNNDSAVHGILIQLPVPKHISEHTITSAVVDEKDVDGFGTTNIGELAKRGGKPYFTPCTPKGVMVLLQESGVELKGKTAVVLGRSDIVGSPVSYLLKNADATVTVCHSKTKNIKEVVQQADVLVAAIGQANFVKGDWLKPGAVVIDVGTNYVEDSSKASGQRLVGDVEFATAAEVASQITPVPGGVGPMTVAMLMQNVVDSASAYFERLKARHVTPLPIKLQTPVPSDIAISRSQHPRQITQIAADVGIAPHELEPYGAYKAKVDLSLLSRLEHRKNGKYILVSGITPTPLGEGKSTTTMGLTQALGGHLGKIAFANVRQPSMGPTFGIKGGAAGGGYSQVIPMDEFNLHLTGDIHAITAANNLLAAAIDTRMFHESTQKDGALYKRLVPSKKGKREFAPVMFRRLKKLGIDKTNPDDLTAEEISRFARLDIDPETITWRRVLDVNDRYLRGITIGQAPTEKGHSRETAFDISVASECMAILALCSDLKDLRERLGRMVIGFSKAGDPVTCDDIGAGGALTALMRDAIKPNLMQSLEGTPVFVHAGPFANISIGNSSVIADKLALKLAGTEPDEDHESKAGFVVTEAGFDFTMGGERFFNIKCRASGLVPDVVVVVATIRALKVHGGGPEISAGAALPETYRTENTEMLRAGCVNLKKHISNAKSYGIPVVVAINKFETDTDAELKVVEEEALSAGAEAAVPANHWAEGGAGAVDLAKAVVEASSKPKDFKLLYGLDGTVQERIEKIGKEMYGAEKVEFSELAQKKVDMYNKNGFGNLPICIAKTQYSLSHDPALKGAPTGFTVPIRDVRLALGAGYLYALAADIQTIPGLPTAPGYLNVDVDPETGEIDGLF
ncbi:tetrahydrofolate synthase [Elasticomyces elasticus]|uniref:Tetrahydrofolate synthase n=1 Tax=Exophiala sideris TaxID=1016849 RepID=A0ABR0JCH9_9EURO|nr:tetrahydrofolate synthase [Elasticomyces elasticus]KAK5031253.1 tetrahydrofolate synthase [Exophiala sideris]KAK5038973.1 tetrahydrofolate synthase [Exophiala sideris]KAK5060858.1 tetrahydrofolate synthase [Exophiala sideris]KAK5183769.1 tetrahydrofolate synthase [Eurotiomycetes sp. CCFEE 6388]